MIFPLTLGTDKKPFAEGTIPAAFTLTESTITPSGVIMANYKRAGNVETGTVEWVYSRYMSTSGFQSSLNELNKAAKQLTAVLVPQFQKMMTETSEKMKPFMEYVHRALEDHELNIKTGWWYPNYIVDDLPDAVVQDALRNEAEIRSFTKLVVKECRRDNYAKLREMHDRWQSYEFLEPGRKKILGEILSAHMDKRYTLSIPIAMIHIDRFHHAIFPAKGEMSLEYTSRERIAEIQQLNFAKRFDKNAHGRVRATVHFEMYPVYHYFKNVLYAGPGLRKFQKEHDPEMYKLSDSNNRGSILHGDNVDYGTEARSLKQLLLLDKLLSIYHKLRM